MRFFRIGIVGLAAVGVSTAAPVVMEASAAVPPAHMTLSSALHLRDLYGFLANAALAAPASFAAKPCKGKKCPPAKKPAPPPPAPPACTPAPAPATTFGKNCPPPGTPNDGMYRPGCQGYGRRDVRARAELADLAMMSAEAGSAGAKCPPAGTPNDGVYRPGCPGFGLAESAAFALTTASQKARCPAPGTPNDGIYRPGCAGYGRRRDVQDSETDSEDDSALSDAAPEDDSPDSAGNIFLAATSGLAAPTGTDASAGSPADALNLSAPLRSMLSKIADLLDQVTSIQTTGLLGGTNSTTSSFPAKQLLSSASSDEEESSDTEDSSDADASLVADTDAPVDADAPADADSDSSTSVIKTTKSSKSASPELPPKAAWSQTTVISTVKQGAAPSDSSEADTSDSDSDGSSSGVSDAVNAATALSQSDRRRSVAASTSSQDRHARGLDATAAVRSGTAHNEWLSLWAKVQNAHSASEAASHARALLRRQLSGDDASSDAAVASSGDGSADSDSSSSTSSSSSSDAAGSSDGLGLTGDSSSADTPPAGSIWEAYATEDPAVFETLGRAFLTAVANIAAQGSVDSSE